MKKIDDRFADVGGSDTYTGVSERDVGGITSGQAFTEATMQEMWDYLLHGITHPTLVSPSHTFVASTSGNITVGTVLDITFTSGFNRGSITPQYTTLTPYRSGNPNAYQFTGTGLVGTSGTSLTNVQSITGYSVTSGTNSWQSRVSYDIGPQPKNSDGSDYLSPYAAGTTGYITVSIVGVAAVSNPFATTVTITVMTEQPTPTPGFTYVQTDMVPESDVDKHTADFPVSYGDVTGILFYNTLTSTWVYLGGGAAASLAFFTTSSVTHDIVNYTRYTYNGTKRGARMYRFEF